MLAIINAHILTITQGTIENGTILVEDGKIKAVGRNLPLDPAYDVMDVEGAFVMPGLIDAHTAVGLKEEGLRWEGDDSNENTRSPIMPHLMALDGFNPEDESVYDAMEYGVTTVAVAPGTANVVGGQVGVFKMWERPTADELYVKTLAMQVALGEEPKNAWRAQKKIPSTRMGTAFVLREALTKAKTYCEKNNGEDEEGPPRDLQHEALARVLTGELPLYVHAQRADDMATALRIAKEFGLRLIFTGATEAHKLTSALKTAQAAAIIGPISGARTRVETASRSLETPALLEEAGVKYALTTKHPEAPLFSLVMQAGLAVRGGLSPEAALKAITIYPAQILGLDEHIGSIEVGKDADLAIWDGHPLKVRSSVAATMVQGELVFEVDHEYL